MAADSWIIAAGNRDYLDINITVNDVVYSRRIPISQISAATQNAALIKLRALLVQIRDQILAEKTVPAVVQNAIGYTEAF